MTELRDLERLAPDIDVDLAATQFRRSIRAGRQRRWAGTAAVVALLATSAIGAALIARDDRTPIVAGPDPVTEGPPCSAIEAFAWTLMPTRFVANYEGTDSPAELVETADVVFAGTLTGELEYEVRPEATRTDHVAGYRIAVTDHIAVSDFAKAAASVWPGAIVTVWDPQISPVGPDAIRDRIPAGAPVLVAADFIDGPEGKRLTPLFEGFMTACQGGPPLGAVGTQGTWPTFTTFDALRAALGFHESSPPVPKRERIELFTHCGVRSLVHDGVLWIATPPIPDAGRPPGWGFNFTPGVFVVLDADSARFDADSGVTAHFRRAAPGEPDPAGGCD
jgi:hypothetical protein